MACRHNPYRTCTRPAALVAIVGGVMAVSSPCCRCSLAGWLAMWPRGHMACSLSGRLAACSERGRRRVLRCGMTPRAPKPSAPFRTGRGGRARGLNLIHSTPADQQRERDILGARVSAVELVCFGSWSGKRKDCCVRRRYSACFAAMASCRPFGPWLAASWSVCPEEACGMAACGMAAQRTGAEQLGWLPPLPYDAPWHKCLRVDSWGRWQGRPGTGAVRSVQCAWGLAPEAVAEARCPLLAAVAYFHTGVALFLYRCAG